MQRREQGDLIDRVIFPNTSTISNHCVSWWRHRSKTRQCQFDPSNVTGQLTSQIQTSMLNTGEKSKVFPAVAVVHQQWRDGIVTTRQSMMTRIPIHNRSWMALSTHKTPSGMWNRAWMIIIRSKMKITGFLLPSIHSAPPFFTSVPQQSRPSVRTHIYPSQPAT